MKPNTKVALCLVTILGLVLTEGGLLIADIGNIELVKQLRNDIDLLLVISGIIITALVTTIGILWNSLRSSQNAFIKTLKNIKGSHGSKDQQGNS